MLYCNTKFYFAIILSLSFAYVITGENPFIICMPPVGPQQIRIALRSSYSVTVSWKTSGYKEEGQPDIIYNDNPSPEVIFSFNPGLKPGFISQKGSSTHYESVTRRSWFHDCELLILPNTRYYFQTAAGKHCSGNSNIYSFMSPPALHSAQPFNVTIVGDLGNNRDRNNNSASRTMSALNDVANTTALFLHIGDISYADDWRFATVASYNPEWDLFQNSMEAITARNFYMTAPGNHEATCNQLGDFFCNDENGTYYRNFAPYLARFRMPGNESTGFRNMWYSFNYGLAHFVIINTETDFPNAPSGPGTCLNSTNFRGEAAQKTWLAVDLFLASQNRKNVPWIIVVGHRPFYGSAPNYTAHSVGNASCHFSINSDNCGPCRDAFATTLFTFNVDFYFSGHVHWYERLWPVNIHGMPVAYNYTNQKGLIHITTGAGGAAEGVNYINVTGKAPASALILPTYGFTQLEIKNSSHCQLRFYDSIQGNVTDTVNIIRNR